MRKDERSSLNPFTGKSHYDNVDDDEFLAECYQEYYNILNRFKVLDYTPQGRLIANVTSRLIDGVEDYLAEIGRSDYTQDYYDWEFHLTGNDEVNAICIPGGKIMVYSGILQIANTEERIAFILGHEMAHALLDHTRTQTSVRNTKNAITTLSRIGSVGLILLGQEELGLAAGALTNIADIGSELFLIKPHGRDQELEADKLGMLILHWAGYDISGVPEFWQDMSSVGKNDFDFFSTHPTDEKRIAAMYETLMEIENQTDFYSQPVLATSPNTSNMLEKVPTLGTPSVAAAGVSASGNKTSANTCSYCGNIVKIGDVFCTNCGNKLNIGLTCDRCGNPVNEDDSFCTNCGNKLTKELKCINCGTPLKEGDVFCTNCGNKV